MSGKEIAIEIMKRKGSKPSPGTVYPVLKSLSKSGFIKEIKGRGKIKTYHITKKGAVESEITAKRFVEIFCDMKKEFEKK